MGYGPRNHPPLCESFYRGQDQATEQVLIQWTAQLSGAVQVPQASKPRIAVIVLTKLTHRGLWELAKNNGAYVCFAKQHTSGEDLDRAIQRAMAFVGQMPEEDRYRVPIVNYGTSRTAE